MIRKAKFEFFLPLRFNARKKKNRKLVPKKLFGVVRRRLANKFGGVTMQESPNMGLWLYQKADKTKKLVPDESYRFEVWADVNEGRKFFKKYREEQLLKLFKQKQIPIIEATIEVF